MKLLITGGAGYIGSHMVMHALEKGHDITILDDFSTGHKWATQNCNTIEASLLDTDLLNKSLRSVNFDGVIHFAAKSIVSESSKNPLYYYQQNISASLNLISIILQNNIENLVFSSSAAIFGEPQSFKISENHPKNPVNVYGRSKLFIEKILYDISQKNNLNVSCLRYFNAAGAHPSGKIGEMHTPETHLIPNILKTSLENNKSLKVFGNDYPTKDGTCIRDYVHVMDLAEAHLLAMENMRSSHGFSEFNLGNGNGFSVMEVIKSCEKIVGNKIKLEVLDRREGDPAVLVADNKRAIDNLGWTPKYENLDSIIETAWNWHKKLI